MNVFNTIVGIVSLLMTSILGGLSIWLSLYFYNKAKDSEKAAAIEHESIRVQTDALQKLTGKWMDRFTRYATEPKPADESLKMLVDAMSNIPTMILTYQSTSHSSSQKASTENTPEELRKELISAYVGLYYYIALMNMFAQGHLPERESFDPQDYKHNFTLRMLNQSAADFDYIADTLIGFGQELEKNSYPHLLAEARSKYRQAVKNANQTFEWLESLYKSN